jgi:hypothetical protein
MAKIGESQILQKYSFSAFPRVSSIFPGQRPVWWRAVRGFFLQMRLQPKTPLDAIDEGNDCITWVFWLFDW